MLDIGSLTLYNYIMPRREVISVGEYYHVYNRENRKQEIFSDERDWVRFLFLILHMQSPAIFLNINRPVSYFVRHRKFNISKENTEDVIKNRYVELVNFCLMPNHFHLTVREVTEGGISRYLQRVQIAYAKYLNTKHGKSGHLFQGAFKSVHVEDNEQLVHLSAYIHRNPREINEYKDKEDGYEWSSFGDYTSQNRWGGLLKKEIISEQFPDKNKYKEFVDTSGTKLFDDEC